MPPRDLSTRLAASGRLSLIFEPRDAWVGGFFGPDALYVTLIPCLIVIRWAWKTPGSRDLSTRLFRRGRFSLILEPRNGWAGGYIGPKAVYACLVPCLALKWERRSS